MNATNSSVGLPRRSWPASASRATRPIRRVRPAYATHAADKLPGLFRAGIHNIAASMQQLGDGSSITNSFVTTSCLTAASRRG
jgi:hypothetical protein